MTCESIPKYQKEPNEPKIPPPLATSKIDKGVLQQAVKVEVWKDCAKILHNLNQLIG